MTTEPDSVELTLLEELLTLELDTEESDELEELTELEEREELSDEETLLLDDPAIAARIHICSCTCRWRRCSRGRENLPVRYV